MFRFSFFAFLTSIALTANGCSAAPSAILKSSASQPASQRQLADRLVARIVKPNQEKDYKETQSYYNHLRKLSRIDRLYAYRKIAYSTDLHEATNAIKILHSEKAPDFFQIINARLPQLSLDSQIELLTIPADAYKKRREIEPEFLTLARTTINRAIKSAAKSQTLEQARLGTLASICTWILATNPDEQNKPVLIAALNRFPKASGIWLNALKMRVVGKAERDLALRTLIQVNKESASFPGVRSDIQEDLRIVLAPYNPRIMAGIKAEIIQFVSKYKNHSVADAELALKNPRTTTNLEQRTRGMNPPLITLTLGSLDVPFDKNPVKLLLNIENPFARRFAYPVLATRYPTQFLMELESGSIQKTYAEVESSGEFVRLLDTLSFDFPERKVELNAIIPQSLIEKERQKYKTQFGILP